MPEGELLRRARPVMLPGGAQHVSSRHEKIKNWLHEISNNYVDYKFNRKGRLHFINFIFYNNDINCYMLEFSDYLVFAQRECDQFKMTRGKACWLRFVKILNHSPT
jgi:hypothetical protein